jgi:hypothetical protein
MTGVLHNKVACGNNMATVRKALMCLCATSPCVAFVRQWLNQGVKVLCSLRTHCSASVAQHIGTVLYLKHLPET